ncbi:protein slowmo [Anaeramoeba ignava]|uniref:Protein slowmo n=1 Tax=Anaeramoeba ignava TaxID=1746090 RepID=A0A9Q0LUG9_ANAIG|nr:protein slowmo [Anaeramoeba ignava]
MSSIKFQHIFQFPFESVKEAYWKIYPEKTEILTIKPIKKQIKNSEIFTRRLFIVKHDKLPRVLKWFVTEKESILIEDTFYDKKSQIFTARLRNQSFKSLFKANKVSLFYPDPQNLKSQTVLIDDSSLSLASGLGSIGNIFTKFAVPFAHDDNKQVIYQ